MHSRIQTRNPFNCVFGTLTLFAFVSEKDLLWNHNFCLQSYPYRRPCSLHRRNSWTHTYIYIHAVQEACEYSYNGAYMKYFTTHTYEHVCMGVIIHIGVVVFFVCFCAMKDDALASRDTFSCTNFFTCTCICVCICEIQEYWIFLWINIYWQDKQL